MRILHLSALYPPHVVGGCERSVEHLAEELVALGHEVGAACIERQAEPKTVRNGVTVYRMFHYNDFWLEDWSTHTRSERRMQKLKQQWNFKVAEDFGKILDDFKPDVLNTHSLLDISTNVWKSAAARNIPIVHSICEYDLICGNAAMFRNETNCDHVHTGCKIVNFSKKFTQKWVDGVASVGTEILKTHTQNGFFHHIPEDLKRVIFYSCTVPGGDPVARRTIDRTGKPLTFGYIGRINTEKGVGTMVDAFREVGPGNWRCIVAGKALDDSVERFKESASDLPIEFLGWAEPKTFFEQIDILICPSYWAEPSPRTIYEAYSMGVPVIGSRAGGIPELIGEDNANWLFDAGDAHGLADRIRWALTQSRESLPTEADFEAIIDASKGPRVAENYVRLYEDVLRSKSADKAAVGH